MKKILIALIGLCISSSLFANTNGTVYLTNNSVMPYEVSVSYKICHINPGDGGPCGPIVYSPKIAPGAVLQINNLIPGEQIVDVQSYQVTYQGQQILISDQGDCNSLWPNDMGVLVAAGTPPVIKCRDFSTSKH